MLETVDTRVSPLRNHLLAVLPQDVQARLFPFVELVTLSSGQVMCEAGNAQAYVYFPVDAIVSLLNVMESGASSEIAMVGNEGVVGFALLMGGENTSSRAVVQSAGYAYRLKANILTTEFNRHGRLLELMLRYAQSLMTQMSQGVVCNRYHSIDQQLCRWLLFSLDRLPDNHLIMTQELIANRLGVRREGVTEAAGKLQKLKVIDYHRGHITVLDRAQLEALSCECYGMVKKETDRLLPDAFVSSGSLQLVR